MVSRSELCDHLDWVARPPWLTGQFVNEIEVAIKLAAAGKTGQKVELSRELLTVAEVVQEWRLTGIVERVRDGEALCPVDPESGMPLDEEVYKWPEVGEDVPF